MKIDIILPYKEIFSSRKASAVSLTVKNSAEFSIYKKQINVYGQSTNFPFDNVKLVGVKTLTSLDNKNLKEIGNNRSVKNLIIHQSKLAQKAKLDALVCDCKSVKYVKKNFKKEIITPGIRLNSNKNDQKRTMTPKEAFKNGSNSLVIGRPITKGNIKKNIQTLINHLDK